MGIREILSISTTNYNNVLLTCINMSNKNNNTSYKNSIEDSYSISFTYVR
jgi:hypothetical protein